MKFFKKKPSANAILVQELQLALNSAQETSRTLQQQLQRETEVRTTLEMALDKADHRYKTLQESLDLNNKALSASRAEVRALQDQIHGLHQDKHNIALLQEEMAAQTASFKMEKEAMKSSYGQLEQKNGNFLKKIQELEGQRDQQDVLVSKMKLDSGMLQEKLHIKIKELTEELQETLTQYKSLQLDHSSKTQEVQNMEVTITTLLEEKQSLKADCKDMKRSFQTEKKFLKGEFMKFKVKAFQIIKHLESSLKEQSGISTKLKQELLQNSQALTEECQRKQMLETELMEVREELEVTSKKHQEETSALNANVEELYQNLEKSAEMIVNLTETNECLKVTRKELLEWLTESENNVKQLREELHLKTKPQETQVRQPKDTTKTSGRRWRR